MEEKSSCPETAGSCCTARAADHFSMPSVPGWPQLRAGTQLDAMYARLITGGTGFHRTGAREGLPRVLVVFDTWCPDSNRFWKTALVLKDEIDFHWFPVCVTHDISTAQAAAILAADDPWALACESEDLFYDPDFRGINPADYPVTQEQRNTAWNNSRIFRRAGGTSVPLGIYRTRDNRYIPFFSDFTAEEMRRVVFGRSQRRRSDCPANGGQS